MLALLSGERMKFESFRDFPASSIVFFGCALKRTPKLLSVQLPYCRVSKSSTCRCVQNGYHNGHDSLKAAPTVFDGEDLTTTAK